MFTRKRKRKSDERGSVSPFLAKRTPSVWFSDEVLAIATYSLKRQDEASFLQELLHHSDVGEFFRTRDYFDLYQMLVEKKYNFVTKLFDRESNKRWAHEFMTSIRPQIDTLQIACLNGNIEFVMAVLSQAMEMFKDSFFSQVRICIPESFFRESEEVENVARTFQGSYLSSLLYMVAICYEMFENFLLYTAVEKDGRNDDESEGSSSDSSHSSAGDMEEPDLYPLAQSLIDKGAQIDELPEMFRGTIARLMETTDEDKLDREFVKFFDIKASGY